ncbi:translation initiation factor IF-2 [Polaribacter sp. Z014]|uniref:translation initiation factor IF-2 n=1 Tax=unclassified Polaribacter TaxID=196858 RepID=UPI00193B3E3A|nr:MULTISPECIES: translation initiation factor IF-2 [unclassified Polaribacter]MCL7762407.1 translation initiation factor IF-2 [Polaribacter sp. Z014]QVY64169.1 translation initiation factor IF-2 [Polaribacter sp. Q13]
MSVGKTMRLNKVLRELNISLDRAVEYLAGKGHEIESRPTTKITGDVYQVLLDGFEKDANKKAASKEVGEEKRKEKEAIRLEHEAKLEKKKAEETKKEEAKKEVVLKAKADKLELKTVGKIDIDNIGKKPSEKVEKVKVAPKEVVTEPKAEEPKVAETPVVEAKAEAPKVEEKPVDETPVVETPKVVKPEVKKTVSEIEKEVSKVGEKPKGKKDVSKTEEKAEEVTAENAEAIKTQYKKLDGPNFTGKKIDLKQFERPKKKKPEVKKDANADKKKRKRIVTKAGAPGSATARPSRPGQGNRGGARTGTRPPFNRGGRGAARPAAVKKEEPTEAEIQKQVRETLEKLQGKSSRGKGAKYRRNKRDAHREHSDAELEAQALDNKILKVTEFVTVSEVATMMEVPVTNIISACMSLGMMVTMNQRLDAETLVIVAEEFNHKVEFVGAEVEESIEEVVDKPEDLESRAPIITVMGHVDHGKTSLLDYIRKANVIEGESGGITQHIGAYSVKVGDQKIAFLDTPGHEAFTAMRARGAQVTDLVIIVVAADDDVMPQTKEAISHAQAAGVPIIFAINKIDKPNANPDNVKTQLSQMNLLIEEWGGNIQSQDISAKLGTGVPELLEKVLLEAEILELKANPNKNAVGAVVEALLDKGRGYVSTVLVQAGTLKIGDYLLAGKHSGKVRAMFDDKGTNLKVAGPSTPVSILGLDGAPQAGDKFVVFDDEREAKQIASKRSQLQREQSVRTQKTLTLDEIGRRIALGDFKELNIILKGDVDGSVEALTDSFQKLSTEEIQVNILHKGVGAITESDVLLASASDAIIVGFNVRPQGNARVVADREEVDIRTYSIIYAAINDLKDAMEGMLSPEMKEEVTGNVEIREIYKISKVGNIAGCMVMSGKIQRDSQIRIIRDGIVVHDGTLTALKRFKDDVREVTKGFDCGIQIKNYNDIEEGDVIEAYKEVAVKKKLK